MIVGGDEPLKEALPQWPALLSAAFYRPGPAPPTPTHTGSSHASCTLPLWFTHREKRLKFSIMHLMLDIILTSEFLPHCIGVEKIFFQLVSIVFLFFQNVIYWCGISASCIQEDRQILKNMFGDWCVITVTLLLGQPHSDNTYVSMWCPALCSPSPISFSIALHSLVTEKNCWH